MLISSSSRYSIYKVQFASPLRGSLLTISHALPFVKKFFLLFSNFFAVPFAALFAEQLGYLSTPDSVCQELFSFLFKFYPGFAVFPLSSQTACIYYQIPHALSSAIFDFFHLPDSLPDLFFFGSSTFFSGFPGCFPEMVEGRTHLSFSGMLNGPLI